MSSEAAEQSPSRRAHAQGLTKDGGADIDETRHWQVRPAMKHESMQ
jgi:hypothetical protein